MKLKERIAVTRRGYRMLAEYCPKLIRTKVIAAAAEALSPFVTIWFSGRIINEITGNRDIGTLTALVLLTVGLGFAFSMIRNALNRVISEKESRMWNDFSKIFTDKQMSMDFADLEDPRASKATLRFPQMDMSSRSTEMSPVIRTKSSPSVALIWAMLRSKSSTFSRLS